jgi:hypothetical protein
MGLDEVDELARDLDQLAAEGPARAATRAAPRLLQVAAEGWAAGRAPDGAAWPATKDGRVPLLALTSQASARADGAAVVLELPDELLPHQAGGRLPQRQVVPAPGEALPPSWQAPLEDALEEQLEELRSAAR